MARPAANPLPLHDGRTVSASLKQRGDVYRVQFPDPLKPGTYKEVTTGKRTENEAWQEAGKIVLASYTAAGLKPTAKTITWDEVLVELAKHGGKRSVKLRDNTLSMYSQAVANLRKTVATRGPADVSTETARRFATLFASTPYTRGKPQAVKRGPDKGKVVEPKQYVRSAKTVDNAIHFLSCLWSAIIDMKLAHANPFADCPRPTVDTTRPTIPTEADFQNLFAWIESRGWELMSVFLRVKALAGCRTQDLCQVKTYQFDAMAGTLTILPSQNKTKQTRTIPLPESLAKRVEAIKGEGDLWGRYAESIREHKDDPRIVSEFSPKRLGWAVRRLFEQYAALFPDRPRITPHNLRSRAITQAVKISGSVDAAAEAIGVKSQTARKHYLDSEKAFDSTELLKKMASALLPD